MVAKDFKNANWELISEKKLIFEDPQHMFIGSPLALVKH